MQQTGRRQQRDLCLGLLGRHLLLFCQKREKLLAQQIQIFYLCFSVVAVDILSTFACPSTYQTQQKEKVSNTINNNENWMTVRHACRSSKIQQQK